MIHVDSMPLPENAQAELDKYQSQVDAKETYEEQVEKANSSFKSKNKNSNRTFKEVRKTLDRMCPGARRCHYCEDSAADEIEHFYPKDLYPEHCFRWENYLYSCGRCNGTYKSNKFKVFEQETGTVSDITPPRRNRKYEKPPAGRPLLIDPRQENPLDYLKLNLMTFEYEKVAEKGSEAFERGKWTKECLGLNTREVLVKSRMEAFCNYRTRLVEYNLVREKGPSVKVQKMIKDIKTMSHPNVWQEMVRQNYEYPELRTLFEAAPEALGW